MKELLFDFSLHRQQAKSFQRACEFLGIPIYVGVGPDQMKIDTSLIEYVDFENRTIVFSIFPRIAIRLCKSGKSVEVEYPDMRVLKLLKIHQHPDQKITIFSKIITPLDFDKNIQIINTIRRSK